MEKSRSRFKCIHLRLMSIILLHDHFFTKHTTDLYDLCYTLIYDELNKPNFVYTD